MDDEVSQKTPRKRLNVPIALVSFVLLVVAAIARLWVYSSGGSDVFSQASDVVWVVVTVAFAFVAAAGILSLVAIQCEKQPWRGLAYISLLLFVIHLVPHIFVFGQLILRENPFPIGFGREDVPCPHSQESEEYERETARDSETEGDDTAGRVDNGWSTSHSKE